MVLEGLQRVPGFLIPYCNITWVEDQYDSNNYEEIDKCLSELGELTEAEYYDDETEQMIWFYQRLAEIGDEGAARRIKAIGEDATKTIVKILRPVDQRLPSPKTR